MRLLEAVSISMVLLGACTTEQLGEGHDEEAATIGGGGGGGGIGSDVLTMPNAAALYRTDVTLSATLSGPDGTVGAPVKFYIDSTEVGTAATNLQGTAELTYLMPATIHSGAHAISAVSPSTSASASLDVVKAQVAIIGAYLYAVQDPTSASANGYQVAVAPYLVSQTTPSVGVAAALSITFDGVTKTVDEAACAQPDTGCTATPVTFSVGPKQYGKTLTAYIQYAGDADHVATGEDTNSLFIATPNAAVPVYNLSIYANGLSAPLQLTQSHELRIHVTNASGTPIVGLGVWAYGFNTTGSTYPNDPWQQIMLNFPSVTNSAGDAIWDWPYDSPLLPGAFNLGPGIVYNNEQFQIGNVVYADLLNIGLTDVDPYVTMSSKPSPGGTVAVNAQLHVHATGKPLANQAYYVEDNNGNNVCSATTNANGDGTCTVTIPPNTAPGEIPYMLGIVHNDYSMDFPNGSKFWIDVL